MHLSFAAYVRMALPASLLKKKKKENIYPTDGH